MLYLFVVLGLQDPHPLHWQAGVAQRTGLAAVAGGGVHALHSREAGVKLTLQREDVSAGEAAKCMWFSQGFSTRKAFRLDDTFAHEKKRKLKGSAL